MMSRFVERILLLLALLAVVVLFASTNKRLSENARTTTSKYSHLDHRINNLCKRMDTNEEKQVSDKKSATIDETIPVAFDPMGMNETL